MLSGLGSRPQGSCWGHSVVSSGKTLYSHRPLYTHEEQVDKKWIYFFTFDFGSYNIVYLRFVQCTNTV